MPSISTVFCVIDYNDSQAHIIHLPAAWLLPIKYVPFILKEDTYTLSEISEDFRVTLILNCQKCKLIFASFFLFICILLELRIFHG